MICRGEARVTSWPAISTWPADLGPHAHEGLDQLALPVALDAGDAEDLAGAHLEVEPVDGGDAAVVVAPQVAHPQHDVARAAPVPCRS